MHSLSRLVCWCVADDVEPTTTTQPQQQQRSSSLPAAASTASHTSCDVTVVATSSSSPAVVHLDDTDSSGSSSPVIQQSPVTSSVSAKQTAVDRLSDKYRRKARSVVVVDAHPEAGDAGGGGDASDDVIVSNDLLEVELQRLKSMVDDCSRDVAGELQQQGCNVDAKQDVVVTSSTLPPDVVTVPDSLDSSQDSPRSDVAPSVGRNSEHIGNCVIERFDDVGDKRVTNVATRRKVVVSEISPIAGVSTHESQSSSAGHVTDSPSLYKCSHDDDDESGDDNDDATPTLLRAVRSSLEQQQSVQKTLTSSSHSDVRRTKDNDNDDDDTLPSLDDDCGGGDITSQQQQQTATVMSSSNLQRKSIKSSSSAVAAAVRLIV